MVLITHQFPDILIIHFTGITGINGRANILADGFTALIICCNKRGSNAFGVNLNLPHIQTRDITVTRLNNAL